MTLKILARALLSEEIQKFAVPGPISASSTNLMMKMMLRKRSRDRILAKK